MKILDSDHCVAILRGKLDVQLFISPTDVLATTTITVGELTHGAYKSVKPTKNLAKVAILLSSLTIFPFTAEAAHQFGELKAYLEKTGQPLSDLDLQIASIALIHNLPLLSHNQRHFIRIPNLILEDWL